MEKSKPFCVVSHFNENIKWLEELNLNGIIYTKGNEDIKIKNFVTKKVKNYGGNQIDIIRFIYENYDNLPKTIAFLQANPFDHCSKEFCSKKILENKFFSLETYQYLKDGWGRRKSLEIDNGFTERNTSWYIESNNIHLLSNKKHLSCKFLLFDDFMDTLFDDYSRLEWLRFCPGSQYIVEDWRCLNYSKSFWSDLYEFFPKWENKAGLFPTENFILERCLWYIFMGIYSESRTRNLLVDNKAELNKFFNKKIKSKKSLKGLIIRILTIYKKPEFIKLIFEKLFLNL